MLVSEQCFEIAYFEQDKLYKSIIQRQQQLLKDKQRKMLDHQVTDSDYPFFRFCGHPSKQPKT